MCVCVRVCACVDHIRNSSIVRSVILWLVVRHTVRQREKSTSDEEQQKREWGSKKASYATDLPPEPDSVFDFGDWFWKRLRLGNWRLSDRCRSPVGIRREAGLVKERLCAEAFRDKS